VKPPHIHDPDRELASFRTIVRSSLFGQEEEAVLLSSHFFLRIVNTLAFGSHSYSHSQSEGLKGHPGSSNIPPTVFRIQPTHRRLPGTEPPSGLRPRRSFFFFRSQHRLLPYLWLPRYGGDSVKHVRTPSRGTFTDCVKLGPFAPGKYPPPPKVGHFHFAPPVVCREDFSPPATSSPQPAML